MIKEWKKFLKERNQLKINQKTLKSQHN